MTRMEDLDLGEFTREVNREAYRLAGMFNEAGLHPTGAQLAALILLAARVGVSATPRVDRRVFQALALDLYDQATREGNAGLLTYSGPS